MREPKLTPADDARLADFIRRSERDFEGNKVWRGDDTNHAPLPPGVLTARDIYKRAFGFDMPDNVTATWEGSTLTFHAKIDPVEIPVSFYFGASDE